MIPPSPPSPAPPGRSSGARGFLTAAVRDPAFLEMAVDLALSLREWSDLPVALATDGALAGRARRQMPGVFQEVRLIEERFLIHRAVKFGAARTSPWDEAVFLDADCLVLGDPSVIFQAAGRSPLSLIGELLTPEDHEYHHGVSTRWLMGEVGLARYLKNHSGVFHLRREGALPILDECLESYLSEVFPLAKGSRPWRFPGDELAFGIVGGRRGLEPFRGPAPLLWPHEMRALGELPPGRPVLHFIGPLPGPFLDHAMTGVRRRRQAADLPPHRSERLWRRKARRAGILWRLGRMHRRLVLLPRG